MSRTIFITFCLILICLGFSNAQTRQGNMLASMSSTFSLDGSDSDLMNIGYTIVEERSDQGGGNVSVSHEKLSLNLQPKVGYFILDKFAIGLDVSFAYALKKHAATDDKSSKTLLGAGPFIRYYMPTSTVSPFFELNCSFGSIKETWEGFFDTERRTYSLMSFGGGIGLAVPLGDKVVLDFLGGYNSVSVKANYRNEHNERKVTGTIGVKLGLTVFIGEI